MSRSTERSPKTNIQEKSNQFSKSAALACTDANSKTVTSPKDKFKKANSVQTKRPLVANLSNVPSVKLDRYAGRVEKQYFYMPGKEPKPSQSEDHGGLYYSKDNYDKFFWRRPASL